MDRPTTTDSPLQTPLDQFLGRSPPSPRMLLLRRIGVAAVALLLGGVVYYWFASRGDDEPAYVTAPVQRGDLRVTVAATGNLQPTNKVEVGSELSGLVTEVGVDNNDQVTKGQVIARLDTARLQDTIAQSRAALLSAQAGVAQAEATAQQTRAALARLEEVRQLSGGKVPSVAEFDTAHADNSRAGAGLQTAQAAVAQARAQLSSDETQSSKALIRSPVTGVVLSRQVDPGQTVAASLNAPVLFVIAEDLRRMRLEVKVDEADVGQVTAGQAATFQVDAFPGRTFPATVERIDVGANASDGSSASTASSSSGTVVAYTAVLAVDNGEGILRPGMTATAEIVTTERRGVLLLPNAALRFTPTGSDAPRAQGGGVTSVLVPQRPRGTSSGQPRDVAIGRGSAQTVYLVGPDGQPAAVQVRTGDSNGNQTEVTSEGLREGALVITGQLATGARASGGPNVR